MEISNNEKTVIFCSSEVFPFVKTGGLADVSGALPIALGASGWTVKVFMPYYKGLACFGVNKEGYLKRDNVEYFFIQKDEYFCRDGLYGLNGKDFPDNAERFDYFARAILERLKKEDIVPDIIHLNDWQTAMVSVYLKTKYAHDEFFKKTKTLLTIHNLAYQGVFPKSKLHQIGVSDEVFYSGHLEFYDKLNYLKAGICYSDVINTVSPNYARQIQTEEYGCGLDGVIRSRRKALYGILNATDYSVWNPEKDGLLFYKYGLTNIVEGKKLNKAALRKAFGLGETKNKFLLGMVTRIAEQKGFDILLEALPEILKVSQLVVLGLGDEKYQKALRQVARKNNNFSAIFKFDERLAHNIYAGSDCFLMPSRFEPCGLSQLISYKYGTLPIVHLTGGLKDTVRDASFGGCGFIFDEYTSVKLKETIFRAAGEYENKEKWQKMIISASQYEFSWRKTAKEYSKLYSQMLG